MENFLFTISGSEIRGLEERLAQPLINNNPNSFKIGGLLILAVRESDNSVTKFKIFLVCWDISSSIAKLVIPGLNRNLNEIRIDDELIGILDEQELSPNIAMLEVLAPFSRVPIPEDIQNPNIINPDRWFKLAFVDKVIYDEMVTSNDFYYGSNIDPNRYTIDKDNLINVNPAERGLNFYAAMSTMYHGIVPSEPVRPSSTDILLEPASFTTLMVRPNPEPVIVDNNSNGSVAYVSIPSCPPYWKPASQLIYSIPGLRFSANRAIQFVTISEDNSQNKPSNWERIIWLLIILILIFIATCKKI